MKKVKFEIVVKAGNEEADFLTLETVIEAIKPAIKSIVGDIACVGIKFLSSSQVGGNTKKPPKLHDDEIDEYELDKSSRVPEFVAELIGEGYTV